MIYLMQISLRISLIQEYPGYFVKKSRYSENLQPNRPGAIQDLKCSISNLNPGLDSVPALSYTREEHCLILIGHFQWFGEVLSDIFHIDQF